MAPVDIKPLILSELLSSYGIQDIIISPGSRNTPLVIACARNAELRCHSIIDERSAAFVGLGMAAHSGKPVALICTSGTAVLNYAPAVAEAYYRNIPLVVISADRPEYRIDQAEGQTIRQDGALSNIVLGTFVLPGNISNPENERYCIRLINEALTMATSLPCGPIHINVPLAEPLNDLDTTPEKDLLYKKTVCKFNLIRPRQILTLSEIKTLANEYCAKKIAVIIGHKSPDAKLSKAIVKLNSHPNIVIFREAQSNIKGLKESVRNIDATLSLIDENERKDFYPDLLISIGGTLVSSSFKNFMRQAPESMQHWALAFYNGKNLTDKYDHLTDYISCEAPAFINGLSAVLKRQSSPDSNFKKKWENISKNAQKIINAFQPSTLWNDLIAVQNLIDFLPEKINLHISNGMAIRYAQLADYDRIHRIDSNRGCNGIDGSTSTAVGAALSSKTPTVLLSGDMSASYDLNGLSIIEIPSTFCIFILNNNGGDIFRIIESTRDLEEREKFMACRPSVNFEEIAKAYGFDYFKIEDSTELMRCCSLVSEKSSRPRLFEICTQNGANSTIYRDLFKTLKNARNG